MNPRKAIRDAITAALKTAYAGEIFTRRRVDPRGLDEFVTVFINSGEQEFDGLDNPTTASLVVSYHSKHAQGDDELDEVGDRLMDALEEADIAPDILRGITPTGFEYGDPQENEYDSLALLFNVSY